MKEASQYNILTTTNRTGNFAGMVIRQNYYNKTSKVQFFLSFILHRKTNYTKYQSVCGSAVEYNKISTKSAGLLDSITPKNANLRKPIKASFFCFFLKYCQSTVNFHLFINQPQKEGRLYNLYIYTCTHTNIYIYFMFVHR